LAGFDHFAGDPFADGVVALGAFLGGQSVRSGDFQAFCGGIEQNQGSAFDAQFAFEDFHGAFEEGLRIQGAPQGVAQGGQETQFAVGARFGLNAQLTRFVEMETLGDADVHAFAPGRLLDRNGSNAVFQATSRTI
jgi:hypothetical protein